MEDSYRKEGGARRLLAKEKEGLCHARSPSLRRNSKGSYADHLIKADQKIQIDWFRIPLLRETETAVTFRY